MWKQLILMTIDVQNIDPALELLGKQKALCSCHNYIVFTLLESDCIRESVILSSENNDKLIHIHICTVHARQTEI